ncbi:Octapeptide-repeat protein T2, partial [Ophiophagus hannah]
MTTEVRERSGCTCSILGTQIQRCGTRKSGQRIIIRRGSLLCNLSVPSIQLFPCLKSGELAASHPLRCSQPKFTLLKDSACYRSQTIFFFLKATLKRGLEHQILNWAGREGGREGEEGQKRKDKREERKLMGGWKEGRNRRRMEQKGKEGGKEMEGRKEEREKRRKAGRKVDRQEGREGRRKKERKEGRKAGREKGRRRKGGMEGRRKEGRGGR